MIDNDAIKLVSELSKTVLDEPTPEILASHLALKILANLDCRGVILGVVQREGFLDLVGTYGYPNSSTEPFIRMPLWNPMPITDAVRTGEMIVFNTPKELVDRYPHLENVATAESAITVSAPIKFRNTVIGAVGFTSMKPPTNGYENSPTTDAILAICGIYLKNFLNKKGDNERDYSHATKSLTERQKQIISLFKDDLTTDQMADRLKYSSSTIKQDIIKIYSICGVNSRQAVLDLATKAGLQI